GAGLNSYFNDASYQDAGATIVSADDVYRKSDVVLKVNPPAENEISIMKKEAVLISFMCAGSNPALVGLCANAGISAFSMDAVPRSSRRQTMDAVSAQAYVAGYKAVLIAAGTIGKILPTVTAAAGTIRACKVMLFGAGVAGLQPIATAKRLGAV